LACVAQDASELVLRSAPVAVAVGGVDEVDAGRDRLVHHALGCCEIDAAAEIVAAEPDDRHFERGASEPPLLHGQSLLRRRQAEYAARLVRCGRLAAVPARN